MKLLLARSDVNPDGPDGDGEIPLWCASRNGREGVVKLLLARSEVDPDKPDRDGETPLWRASSNGHEEVVKMLLARGDVYPIKPDNRGLIITLVYQPRPIVALLQTQAASTSVG